MRKRSLAVTTGAALLGITAIAVPAATAAQTPRPATVRQAAPALRPAHGAADVHTQSMCGRPAPGHLTCFGMMLKNSKGQNVNRNGRLMAEEASAGHLDKDENGYSPQDIQNAYKIEGLTSGGRTVAVVAAFGYPDVEKDLAVYRAKYGLPACTSADGCFKVMNQDGKTDTFPKANKLWGGEQALDVDAVSATCPDCKIVLVQANSSSEEDLGKAEMTAAKQPGVVAISNSFGGPDLPDEKHGSDYNHPGIAVVAGTGDMGFQGASFPSNSQYVTSVGGTTMKKDSSARGWKETVWEGAGSGCSKTNKIIEGQDPNVTGCQNRASADIAALADPMTGFAIYYPGMGGWMMTGGTSLATPLVAGMYALSGNTEGMANTIPYAHKDEFFDITEGSNGTCDHWCKAQQGWDGPTGLGTPNGVKGL